MGVVILQNCLIAAVLLSLKKTCRSCIAHHISCRHTAGTQQHGGRRCKMNGISFFGFLQKPFYKVLPLGHSLRFPDKFIISCQLGNHCSFDLFPVFFCFLGICTFLCFQIQIKFLLQKAEILRQAAAMCLHIGGIGAFRLIQSAFLLLCFVPVL